jgi:predicted RNA binding protein YcfA (HicA-like mRNA interferase family)
MPKFPSMKARDLRRLLGRSPLHYASDRQSGSHAQLTSSAGYPPLTFAFHDGQSLSGGLVREILMKGVGLSEEDAKALL